jgi:hypothetical protein
MRTLDLNWRWRSSVGFDRLIDLIDELGGRATTAIIRLTTSSAPMKTTIKSRWRWRASPPKRCPSRQSRTCLSLKGGNPKEASTNIFTREF